MLSTNLEQCGHSLVIFLLNLMFSCCVCCNNDARKFIKVWPIHLLLIIRNVFFLAFRGSDFFKLIQSFFISSIIMFLLKLLENIGVKFFSKQIKWIHIVGTHVTVPWLFLRHTWVKPSPVCHIVSGYKFLKMWLQLVAWMSHYTLWLWNSSMFPFLVCYFTT